MANPKWFGSAKEIYEYFWGGGDDGTLTTQGFLNPTSLGAQGSDSLAAWIRGLVARDAAVGLALKDESKLVVEYDALTGDSMKASWDEALNVQDIVSIRQIAQTVALARCGSDADFLHRFRVEVDTTVMQAMTVLPGLAEQALLDGLWKTYEDSVYLYDVDSEGNFAEYLDKLFQWLGEDMDAGKKSDLNFLVQTLFPYLKGKGYPISPMIKNISKSRNAVPALRILYDQMVAGTITPEDAGAKISKIISMVGDPKIANTALTAALKAQGLKASRFGTYPAYDWPQEHDQGLLVLKYGSLADKTRILTRLGNLIDADDVHFWTDKLDGHAHYALWAGRAIAVLQKAGIIGFDLNPDWDGKLNTFIGSGSQPESAKIAAQTLYGAGFTSEVVQGGVAVTLAWDHKETLADDPSEMEF